DRRDADVHRSAGADHLKVPRALPAAGLRGARLSRASIASPIPGSRCLSSLVWQPRGNGGCQRSSLGIRRRSLRSRGGRPGGVSVSAGGISPGRARRSRRRRRWGGGGLGDRGDAGRILSRTRDRRRLSGGHRRLLSAIQPRRQADAAAEGIETRVRELARRPRHRPRLDQPPRGLLHQGVSNQARKRRPGTVVLRRVWPGTPHARGSSDLGPRPRTVAEGTVAVSTFHNRTRRTASIPRRLVREGQLHLLPVYYLGLNTALGRAAIKNCGSYEFADHIYGNRPAGKFLVGCLLDALFLILKSARSFRSRYLYARSEIQRLIVERADPIDV